MDENWEEIQERYDNIKDDKSRAMKKLNELGDILSSAYAINPTTANRMWQYIIDLNIADNINYSKYFVAHVFNKLRDRMELEDAITFLYMDPKRFPLLILHGFDKGTLWHYLEIFVHRYISLDDVNGAINCLDYFYQKFGGIHSSDPQIFRVAHYATSVCVHCIYNSDHSTTAKELLIALKKSNNIRVNKYINIAISLFEADNSYDYESLLDDAIFIKCPKEFFYLLWVARNNLEQRILRDKWIKYLQNCNSEDILPYAKDLFYDESDSALDFYVELAKNTDEVLNYYFSRTDFHIVGEEIIWSWVRDDDWERFIKYISRAIVNTPRNLYYQSRINEILEKYLYTYLGEYNSYTVNYWGRERELHLKEKEFDEALQKISSLTMGCDSHKKYTMFLQKYYKKKNLKSRRY